jgi:hypothetical protein
MRFNVDSKLNDSKRPEYNITVIMDSRIADEILIKKVKRKR